MSYTLATLMQQRAALCARMSWLGLTILCFAWEAWLAPLRPGGSWMILKALPLLLLAHRVWLAEVRALQWALLLVPFYFAEGAVRLFEPAPARWCALLELVCGGIFYVSTVVYLRPLKRAASAQRRRDTNS
jgi:uncharacterized membrane protein